MLALLPSDLIYVMFVQCGQCGHYRGEMLLVISRHILSNLLAAN